MNASIESLLILLVFVIISGVSTWMQKRRQAAEEPQSWPDEDEFSQPPTAQRPASGQRPGPTAPPPPPQPQPATSSWEEELRRLLQGDRPTPPSPQPIPPPVPPSPPHPRPSPPPVPASPRPVAASPYDTRRPVPKPPAAPSAPLPHFRPAALDRSAAAYQRASHLAESVAGRMREVERRTQIHEPGAARVRRKPVSREINAARSLLQSPQAARQAVIASVILGPPRGLE
jgi:hypothetical protein